MITLREIWVYPIKSLPGVRVQEARVDDRGFVDDRRFMLVDPAGAFVTQRKYPELSLLQAELDAGVLRVLEPEGGQLELRTHAEGEDTEVQIWGQTVRAKDEGDEAAAFFGNHLGADVRLVHMPSSTRRPADPEFARPDDIVAFQDGFPFLLASVESLALLNARLEEPVDMRRFRPNLVTSGGGAFEEDHWKTLRLGAVTFHVKKSCARCSMVDVDPDRGVQGKRVQAELVKFRRLGNNTLFGQNLVHDGRGSVRVGQALEIES